MSILELIRDHDSAEEHLNKVKNAQTARRRLQVQSTFQKNSKRAYTVLR